MFIKSIKKVFLVSLLLAFYSTSYASLELGDKAPNFILDDQNSQSHQLSDYKGKWVILYFPYLLIYYMQLLEKKGVARICRLQ